MHLLKVKSNENKIIQMCAWQIKLQNWNKENES